jgi:uncharacterized LabA/DUF88 family protein
MVRTYCFIDASNLRHSYRIDYFKLFKYLKKRFDAKKIYYFGDIFVGDYYALHDYLNLSSIDLNKLERWLDKDKHKKPLGEMKFIKKIKYFGYRTYIKPLKVMRGGKCKADCDIDISVKIIGEKNDFDRLILVSGDGDFLPL